MFALLSRIRPFVVSGSNSSVLDYVVIVALTVVTVIFVASG